MGLEKIQFIAMSILFWQARSSSPGDFRKPNYLEGGSGVVQNRVYSRVTGLKSQHFNRQ